MPPFELGVLVHGRMETGGVLRRHVNAPRCLVVPDAYLEIDAVAQLALSHEYLALLCAKHIGCEADATGLISN